MRENSVQKDLKDVDWIPLALDRNQWYHNKHSSSIKGGEFLEQLNK
jgi:hypothetical protein